MQFEENCPLWNNTYGIETTISKIRLNIACVLKKKFLFFSFHILKAVQFRKVSFYSIQQQSLPDKRYFTLASQGWYLSPRFEGLELKYKFKLLGHYFSKKETNNMTAIV